MLSIDPVGLSPSTLRLADERKRHTRTFGLSQMAQSEWVNAIGLREVPGRDQLQEETDQLASDHEAPDHEAPDHEAP